jgi:NAD(P)-dependent dehydrogenase (short-subunit alcohol dehydrogenase family)
MAGVTVAGRLEGKTCIVTGASRGLGRAIAELFCREGAHVLLVARSGDKLKTLRGRLRRLGKARVDILKADLSDRKSPRRIFAKAEEIFPRIDILINNAGIQGPIGACVRNPFGAWEKTFQVNFLALAQLCRLCARSMIRQRAGKIINISGGGAAACRPFFSAYAVSKTALVRFSEILAEEVKPYRVEVNCVAPGAMKSALTKEIIKAGRRAAGAKEYRQARRLQRTGGVPLEKAAKLCLFLASPQAHGITGKLISAVWDPWERLIKHKRALNQSDVYTLRRILPADRGLDWS